MRVSGAVGLVRWKLDGGQLVGMGQSPPPLSTRKIQELEPAPPCRSHRK